VPVLVVVPAEELAGEGACLFDGGKAVRKLRAVLERIEPPFRVRVVAKVCGREWLLVTPRSASATGFEAMEQPLSAWMVKLSSSTPSRCTLSASSHCRRWARGGTSTLRSGGFGGGTISRTLACPSMAHRSLSRVAARQEAGNL